MLEVLRCIFTSLPVRDETEMKRIHEATTIPGLVEVGAVSQRTSPSPVFSLLLWSFSLQRKQRYLMKLKQYKKKFLSLRGMVWSQNSHYLPTKALYRLIFTGKLFISRTVHFALALTSTTSDLTAAGLTSSLGGSLTAGIPR